MSTPQELVAKIRALQQAPTIQPYVRAAQRAAARTNMQYAMAGAPLKATVHSGGSRLSITIQQLGPLTRPFGKVSPLALLRKELMTELPAASSELLDTILRAVK